MLNLNSFAREFKEFISRGNVIDMAVGVIIGSSFGKIVSSLVEDVIMPFVGIIIGGHDFSNLTLKVGDAIINYGVFLQNIVDFLIIAFCIFVFVKIINKLKRTKKNEIKEEISVNDEIILLTEIRDLLKKEKKVIKNNTSKNTKKIKSSK